MNALCATAIVVLLLSEHSFAYLAPDSGYLLWQIIAAGFVGSLYFLRDFWGRLLRLVKRLGRLD